MQKHVTNFLKRTNKKTNKQASKQNIQQKQQQNTNKKKPRKDYCRMQLLPILDMASLDLFLTDVIVF